MHNRRILNFRDAQDYLLGTIPRSPKEKHPGKLGTKRMALFLKLLGNPQNAYKAVHIAGTSGKGSVAHFMSAALESQGFKTGLFISPHLLDVRERVQINRRMLSRQKFVRYLKRIIPAAEKVGRTRLGHPTYFEVLTALVLCAFRDEGVRYAVIETGLGGTYDASNAVKDKFFILTRIGLDHTRLLGNTLEKIAAQKAGIIHAGNRGVSAYQSFPARKAIEKAVRKNRAGIEFIRPGKNFSNIATDRRSTRFDFRFGPIFIPGVKVGLLGEHQAENASLALAALFLLAGRDSFRVRMPKLKKAYAECAFPGRLEIFNKPKLIVVDGAHNPQKMAALAKSIKKIFPGMKFDIVVAFKKGKNYGPMLKELLPFAARIICSGFFANLQDLKRISEDPFVTAEILRKMQFDAVRIEPDPQKALQLSLESRRPVLVTGSLYFIAEIYPYVSGGNKTQNPLK